MLLAILYLHLEFCELGKIKKGFLVSFVAFYALVGDKNVIIFQHVFEKVCVKQFSVQCLYVAFLQGTAFVYPVSGEDIPVCCISEPVFEIDAGHYGSEVVFCAGEVHLYVFVEILSFHCDRVLWVVHQKGRSSCRQAGCGAGAGTDADCAVCTGAAETIRSIFHAEMLLKYRP